MIVVVTRAFLHGGERQEVGQQVDLPEHIARQLMAQNKAAPAPVIEPDAPAAPVADAVPAAEVATTSPTSDPKPAKRPRKGQS